MVDDVLGTALTNGRLHRVQHQLRPQVCLPSTSRRFAAPGVEHDGKAETSVLFELISARYERRSILITANQPFGAWGKVFPDPAMTLTAVDRLVHHATIFEINVDSYRRRAALDRKNKGAGRPQAGADQRRGDQAATADTYRSRIIDFTAACRTWMTG